MQDLSKSKLTLSASQTLTVLSKEDVARRGMLGLKRTSVINAECSSSVDFGFRESACHNTACITWLKIVLSQHDICLKIQFPNSTLRKAPETKIVPLKLNFLLIKGLTLNVASDNTHLFIMTTTGEQLTIWREVTTNYFAGTSTNRANFRKGEP